MRVGLKCWWRRGVLVKRLGALAFGQSFGASSKSPAPSFSNHDRHVKPNRRILKPKSHYN